MTNLSMKTYPITPLKKFPGQDSCNHAQRLSVKRRDRGKKSEETMPQIDRSENVPYIIGLYSHLFSSFTGGMPSMKYTSAAPDTPFRHCTHDRKGY